MEARQELGLPIAHVGRDGSPAGSDGQQLSDMGSRPDITYIHSCYLSDEERDRDTEGPPSPPRWSRRWATAAADRTVPTSSQPVDRRGDDGAGDMFTQMRCLRLERSWSR